MSGRRLVIALEPLSPAAFSARAATEGAHRTLDGPPGAALMGWAASHCYAALGDAAFDVFHAGKVRFSDAVRVWNGAPVFRNPATLLKAKHGGGTPALGRTAFAAANGPLVQPEAVRNVWMTLDGHPAPQPAKRHRLRTAIDRTRRAAEDGKLFGIEAVGTSGMSYRATVECDAGAMSDADWRCLCEAFSGTIRLGRARRSGFGGQYRCTVLPERDSPWPFPRTDGRAPVLRFWLLSDAMLLDEHGRVRAPDAGDFGLDDGWSYAPSHSSFTMRRVWPWNGTIGGRNLELPLVEAGSVIAFERAQAGPAVALPPLIGCGHERGYGRYAVLDDGAFASSNRDRPASSSATPQAGQASALASWADRMAIARAYEDDPAWTRDRIAEGKGRIDRMQGGHPKASQWGEIGDLIPLWVAQAEEFDQSLANSTRHASWTAAYVDLSGWVQDPLFRAPDNGATRAQRAKGIAKVISALRSYQPGRNA